MNTRTTSSPFRRIVVQIMKPLAWGVPALTYLAFAPWGMDVLSAIVWGAVAFGVQVNWGEWFYVPFMNRFVMPWASMPRMTRPNITGVERTVGTIREEDEGVDTLRDPAYSLYLGNYYNDN